MINIENILEKATSVLCQSKLYNQQSFIDTPHKKITLKLIKDISNLSYKDIGKHFNQSWFAIYKSCKDISEHYQDFYDKILKEVKKNIK